MDKITWSTERRKLAHLNPAPYNPRVLTEKQAQNLSESLDKFSLAEPIVINTNNTIIGGHMRAEILKRQGSDEIDVRVPSRELSPEEERELNIRLNKNTGSWDFDALANFDEELLLNVGFEPADLDNIFGLELQGEKDPNAIPEARLAEDPGIVPGEVFQLGEHRLMCGDATNQDHMAKLMAGEEADMVFTDPPYNVNYHGAGENTKEGIKNYFLPEEQFSAFIQEAFGTMYTAMKPGAVFYICSGWSSYPTFYRQLIANGFYRAGVIIWKKDNASYGWNDYRYKHEWIVVGKRKEQRVNAVSILYGWKQGTHYFRDTRDEYDVWEIPRKHSAEYLHPTEKPVWLIEKAMANSTARYQIVLDPFGGSGSTLIACERLKRKARIAELDPHYCRVIKERWENFTGLKAQKITDQAGVAVNG